MGSGSDIPRLPNTIPPPGDDAETRVGAPSPEILEEAGASKMRIAAALKDMPPLPREEPEEPLADRIDSSSLQPLPRLGDDDDSEETATAIWEKDKAPIRLGAEASETVRPLPPPGLPPLKKPLGLPRLKKLT